MSLYYTFKTLSDRHPPLQNKSRACDIIVLRDKVNKADE